MRSAALVLGVFAASIALGFVPEQPAEACGAFFAKDADPSRRPSLSVERVLILHDPSAQTEHFIREVVFRGGKDPFGFVVPTPTKPQVFKVEVSPFDGFERAFPFVQPPPRPPDRGSGPDAAPAGSGVASVDVLEVKKVGSFTAFVLAASDAKALQGWLNDNGLTSTAENDAWLAGYVAREFFYVAFRYEPGDAASTEALKAETVRVTFSTPVGFYPYREPSHALGTTTAERVVALWYASPAPVVPVSLGKDGDTEVWVKPFKEGWSRRDVPFVALTQYLGPEEDKLVPAVQAMSVQPFEDQKTTRPEFGDVVFLPAAGLPRDQRERAKRLLDLITPQRPATPEGK